MTGPIKPPSKPPGALPAVPASEPRSPSGGAGGVGFQDPRATTPELPTHRIASMALADAGLVEVVADLRAGRIGADQVVDTIIDRALHSGAATTLSDTARSHLATLIRRQLEQDPALSALVSDLGKAR